VNEGKSNSHANKGWETFTNRVIQLISDHKNFVVFMLWGRHAQNAKRLIDTKKHVVLEAAHPSPFSCEKFFNCRHFSRANNHLKKKNMKTINWDF
jgi:uracil-DNA glycosylase